MAKGAAIDFDSTRPPSPFLKDEHHAWRRELRRFIDREIMPFVEEWEEAEEIPLSLYKQASDFGLLRMGYPEAYGGISEGIDRFHGIVTSEELARIGAGGVTASLMVHGIGLPPVLALGTEEMKQKIAPAVLSGDKRISLAITEPSGGSDVAQLKTRARRDGDHYVVDGSKMFITGGMRADYFTTAVRTGGDGFGGISLLLIEADRPGVTRTKLKKQGWWASDTAAVYFECPRAGREPHRRREPGLPGHHAQFQRRASRHGGRRDGLGARLSRGSREMGAGAADFRQAPRRPPGDPPQDRGDGAPDQRLLRLSRNVRLAGVERRSAGGRSRTAESAGDADAGILRPRSDAGSWAATAICAAPASSASIARSASTPSAAARKKSCATSLHGSWGCRRVRRASVDKIQRGGRRGCAEAAG